MAYSNGVDEFDNPNPGCTVGVVLHRYSIMKRTEKGAWINDGGAKKFVLLSAKKKFACNTEAEALESFRARKRRQIEILSYRLRKAQAALNTEPGRSTYVF